MNLQDDPAPRIARGGKAIYGAPLGHPDAGSPLPAHPRRHGQCRDLALPGALPGGARRQPERVVLQGARGLLPDFVAAAQELVASGAEAITTNCGFLSLFQRRSPRRSACRSRPPRCCRCPGCRRPCRRASGSACVTVSKGSLTPAHLAAAGVPPDTPVMGTEGGREFFRVLIKADAVDMDVALAEQDILEAGRALVAAHPEVGAIVLECTNMPPYAAALQAAVGLPVFDIYSLISWFHAGLRPRRFAG